MQDNQFTSQFQSLTVNNLGYIKIPKYQITTEDKKKYNIKDSISSEQFLSLLIKRGLQNKIDKNIISSENIEKYKVQANHEYSIYKKLKFTDYILLIHSIINFCQENDILNSPSRGCLHGRSKVLTDDGYTNLQDISVGAHILNSLGEVDTVTAIHQYDCKERLVKFKTYFDTPSELSLTKDHKIFGIKNPFHQRDSKGDIKHFKRDYNLKNIFNNNNIIWDSADSFNTNDYLCRYIGRIYPEKNIDSIDLSIYADKYDDDYIYETHAITCEHPLCIRTIHKATQISRNCLLSLKRQTILKQINTRHLQAKKILLRYLISNGFTLDNFINYNSVATITYNKFINIDNDFCYVLGFFLGDGWLHRNRNSIGFAFHSTDNQKELLFIKSYFSKLGCRILERKSKTKQLTQLYIHSKIFYKFFKSICDKYTIDKSIPQKFLNLPKDKLFSLWMGLMESDGSHGKDGRLSFDNTSYKLINQMRWLSEFLGYCCSISHRFQKGCSKSYKIHISDKVTSLGFNNGKYVFVKINNKKYITNTSNKVYDLTIKNHPSYLTDKFIVHNSCGGSTVLFLIDVIQIDPIKHGLLFERFISSDRTETKLINGELYLASESLPDVDIDSDNKYKSLINQFLSDKFPERTCKISNFTTLQSKLALKECCKIAGAFSEEDSMNVASNIETLFGKNDSINETYDKNEIFKKWCDTNEFIFGIAKKVEGLIKNKSVHASGIFISNEKLIDNIPTELSSNGELVSSYDMLDCALLGIKVDNLGLKNLGAIHSCLKTINKTIYDIDINDKSIYNFFQMSKDFYGIFQCEEGLGKTILLKIKPSNIDEISIAIAMSRPGCYKFADEYVHNRENKITSQYEQLGDILNPTYNIIIFQEQIMKLAVKMANFTPQESNGVRSAIGKKNIEKMKSYKDRFIQQSIQNGFDNEFVTKTWQTFEDSGNYLFNLSHSCGYSYLTAITTYLKVNHTQQYYLCLLKSCKDEQSPIEEISKIHKEMVNFDIQLLPPSLKNSKLDFTIEGKNIRFGLSSIKGISDKTIEKFNNFKREHASKFELFEAAKEAGLGIGILCALIMSGCMDDLKIARPYLVYEAQLWNTLSDKEKKLVSQHASKYDFKISAIIKSLVNEIKDEKNRFLIKESRYETIKTKSVNYKAIYDQNSAHVDLANYWYTKKLIGYSPDKTLRDIFKEKINTLIPISQVITELDKTRVEFIGTMEEDATLGTSKNGNKYAKCIISDETGMIKTMIFKDSLEHCKLLNGRLPKKDDIVIVRGQKMSDDVVFANLIAVQQNKIYVSLADLKRAEKELEKEKKL